MSNTYMNGQAGEITHSDPQVAAVVAPVKRKRKSPVRRESPPPAAKAGPQVSAIIAREFWDWSKPKIVGWFSTAFLALVAGGWIMLPAKQSDLEAVRTEMRAGFTAINDKFTVVNDHLVETNIRLGEVRNTYEAIRNQLASRGTTQLQEAATAPSAPVAPLRRRRAPAPPAPAKATNLFGF